MITYTGYQYLLIDIANHFGLDKVTFEERLDWTTKNLPHLETLLPSASAKPLYAASVMALRDAQGGHPTGHLVAFDAVCSGMQIMAAVTGCYNGAKATGLVDTGLRPDAYTDITTSMNRLLTEVGSHHVAFPREDIKEATMTALYGSKAEPKRLFGEDTVELEAFYRAGQQVAPGPFDLLATLVASWQPFTLSHEWRLPDNFLARVKVMQTNEHRIEVDELDHATFTYEVAENAGSKKGLSNAANVVHSLDAYILRSVLRRTNYNLQLVNDAFELITAELVDRAINDPQIPGIASPALQEHLDRWEATRMSDTVLLPLLTEEGIRSMWTDHLKQLNGILFQMLVHAPFETITVHDSFACHPNHMNEVRYWYKEILAELAESTVLDDILAAIHGETGGTYLKGIPNLAGYIRESNYALC